MGGGLRRIEIKYTRQVSQPCKISTQDRTARGEQTTPEDTAHATAHPDPKSTTANMHKPQPRPASIKKASRPRLPLCLRVQGPTTNLDPVGERAKSERARPFRAKGTRTIGTKGVAASAIRLCVCARHVCVRGGCKSRSSGPPGAGRVFSARSVRACCYP